VSPVKNQRKEGGIFLWPSMLKSNDIYLCAIKRYGVLQLKNAYVDSALYVTEYAICSPAVCLFNVCSLELPN
jgi:hypothetical protein